MAIGEKYPGVRDWYEAEATRVDELADRLSTYLDDNGAITPEVQLSEIGAEVILSLGEVKGARAVLSSLASVIEIQNLPEKR